MVLWCSGGWGEIVCLLGWWIYLVCLLAVGFCGGVVWFAFWCLFLVGFRAWRVLRCSLLVDYGLWLCAGLVIAISFIV